MKFDECLERAIRAGKLDPTLGKQAQDKFRARVDEYKQRGMPADAARIEAANDVASTISREIKARRHATLHQTDVMMRNQARYATAAVTDPDRILKDIEFINSEWQAIERQAFSQIAEFLKNHKSLPFGNTRQRALLNDVTRELHMEDSGNAAAKTIAEGIVAQYEKLRALANAYGMDIPKLHDFGVPHSHHDGKILKAGYDAWFTKLYDEKLLDWNRIINHKTGKPFAVTAGARPLRQDADAFLRPIFDNITTRGWNDRSPSMAIGGKSLGNTRQDSRILHFIGADAWMNYNDAFGRVNPFEAVITHIRGMSRDVAMLRGFGPNPKMGLEHALQVIEKGAQMDRSLNGPAREKMIKTQQRKAKKARVMLRSITGENSIPGSAFWANFFGTVRALLVPAQLGSAVLSSVTDWPSVRLAARAIGLNPNGHTQAMIRQIVKGLSPEQARDMGFIMDTWFDTMASQARFLGSVWQPQLVDRISSGVLRATFLNLLTDSSRVAVKAAMGSDLAGMADKTFDQLPQNLQNFMTTRRITAADWDAMRDPSAIFTDPTGGKHVNAHWFAEHTALPRDQADDIAIRWGAMMQDAVEHGIPTASLRGRATILGDAAPGTFNGELLRSSLMYKSYPLSVMFNQMRRFAEIDGGPANRWLFVARYMVTMTVAGALAVQLKESAKGRDPRPMDQWQFWGGALLQGGGVGIFGDFFSATSSRTGGGLAETLAGPVVGVAGDLARAVNSNIASAAEGKGTHFARDAVNLARRYNPLASFQPPIPVPTRLAMDRLVWDQLQLLLDPTADQEMRKAERKLRKDHGTSSWWKKGDVAPSRAPNLANVISDP